LNLAGRAVCLIKQIRYRAVIEFLITENVQPQQIHNRLIIVCGEDAPSYATVKRWAAEFHRGRTSLEDEAQSGSPSEAVCEENCRAVENIVLQNRGVNVQ
jgi:histone-lysine N-methyltransferase SETMAR